MRMRHWLYHPKYSRYRISDDGLVLGIGGRLLRGDRSAKGYRRYCLAVAPGVYRKKFASHLVLETFVGAAFDGAEAAHLDGDNQNDCVENLAWKTHQENELDKVAHGTKIAGELSHLAKMTDRQAALALSLWETGDYTLGELGERFGVTKQAIWALKEGRSRKSLSMQITDPR